MGRTAVAPEIVEAVARLVRDSGHDLALIAATAGLSRRTVAEWTRRRGWMRLRAAGPRSRDDILADLAALARRSDVWPDAADPATLRQRLRLHVGRQIAAFDAALRGEGAAVIDSARVLRDLGGLKRLLDDLSATEQGGDGRDGSSEPPDLDLPALRAEIARRYGGVPGERPAAGIPGKPAAALAASAGA